MTSWIESLLFPAYAAFGRTGLPQDDPKRGLALLVDGRISDYQRRSSQFGWPQLGAPSSQGEPPSLLLSGLIADLNGSDESRGLYSSVAQSGEAPQDLRVAASVLLSVSLADSAMHDDAVRNLRGIIPNVDLDDHRRLLYLHLAIRLAELGDMEALEFAERAALPSDESRSTTGRLLLDVAGRNLAVLSGLFGRFRALQREGRRLPARVPLAGHPGLRGVTGLTAYVEAEFEVLTEDPRTTTLRFNADDPVLAPLSGSLLSAEVMADWSEIRLARRRLGRVRLVLSIRNRDRQPEPAFHLLRRAADKQGLERALNWYYHEGPLEPVRNVGVAVCSLAWVPYEIPVNLTTIGASADVLPQDVREAVLERIIRNLSTLLEPAPGSRTESDVMGAIAALASVVSPELSSRVSGAIRTLATERDDALLLQSIARVVASLDSEAIGKSEQEQWNAYGLTYVNATDDRRFVAHAALRGAGRISERDREAALRAFEAQPALDTGVLLLMPDFHAPTQSLEAIARLARDELGRRRADAKAGSFGLGGHIDAALVLATLLSAQRVGAGWRDLAGFLGDPSIPASPRIAALDHLAAEISSVPPRVRTSLARRLIHHEARELPFDPPEVLEGARLRFLIAAREIDEQTAAATLVALATHTSRKSRHQAASSFGHAVRAWGSESAASIGLALTRDPAFEIRGSAGRTLAQVHRLVGGPLEIVVQERILELLHDPGAIVPQYVMSGLGVSDIGPDIRIALAEISVSHLSARVRTMARELSGGSA